MVRFRELKFSSVNGEKYDKFQNIPQFNTDPSVKHKGRSFSGRKISQIKTSNASIQQIFVLICLILSAEHIKCLHLDLSSSGILLTL